jgi:hypothetical protein
MSKTGTAKITGNKKLKNYDRFAGYIRIMTITASQPQQAEEPTVIPALAAKLHPRASHPVLPISSLSSSVLISARRWLLLRDGREGEMATGW